MKLRDTIILISGTFLIFFVLGLVIFYNIRYIDFASIPETGTGHPLPAPEMIATLDTVKDPREPVMAEKYFTSPSRDYRISFNLLPQESGALSRNYIYTLGEGYTEK